MIYWRKPAESFVTSQLTQEKSHSLILLALPPLLCPESPRAFLVKLIDCFVVWKIHCDESGRHAEHLSNLPDTLVLIEQPRHFPAPLGGPNTHPK